MEKQTSRPILLPTSKLGSPLLDIEIVTQSPKTGIT